MRLSSTLAVACAGLVLLVMLLALYSFLLPSGQDAAHLGRYGPEGQLRRARRRYGSGLCMAGIPGFVAFALYIL